MLRTVVRASLNVRVVTSQGCVVCVSIVPHTRLSVLGPLSRTVPATARASTVRTRPAATLTTVARLDRNRAVRTPSERTDVSQPPESTGAVV